jgi:hypothetical protein
MANAIAPALAVPDDVRDRALDLLALAAEILERVEPVMRLIGTLDAATIALAEGGQPPLPPGTSDPGALRLYAWMETSGYSLARAALYTCAETLRPDISVGEDELNVARAAEALADVRRFLAEAGR